MDPQSHLLSVLAAHDSPLGREDIAWAFDHVKSADPVTAYIDTYLHPSTLLTLEESVITAHLAKTGRLSKLRPSPGPILTESFLQDETASLAASTALLRARTAELQAQAATLDSMRSRRRAEKERKKRTAAVRRKKWAAERDDATAAFEDLLSALGEEVSDLRGTVHSREDEEQELEKELERDDRVLFRLENLAAGLKVGGGENGGEVLRRVERLVEKLGVLRAVAIRAQLDRVYLENTDEGPGTGGEEVQAQIDELYPDIPTVCRIAAESEFLHPIKTALKKARGTSGENWIAGAEYVVANLAHLRARTTAMTSFLSSSHDRDDAVMALIATIDRESLLPSSTPIRPSTPPQSRPRDKRLGSPVRFSSLGRVPFLTPTNRRRQKSVDLGREGYPEMALLAQLGISLPPSSPDSAVPKISDSFLNQQIRNVAARVEGLMAPMDESTWDTANSEAKEVVRVLEEGLWEGNVYREAYGDGAMRVVRREVLEGVEEVVEGMDGIRGAVEDAVRRVDEVRRCGGDVEGKKAEFVQRWGR